MNLRVRRDEPIDDALPGRLYVDHVEECFTLERLGVEIAPGLYRVLITQSGRALKGSLWSPRGDAGLPLILVSGREGIRIHALNEAKQSDGCLGVGKLRDGARILSSRVALVAVIRKIEDGLKAGDVWLTVDP